MKTIREDEPIPGKVYALTGKSEDKCIANGNSWAENEINKQESKIKELATLIEKERVENLQKTNLACEANITNCKTTIKKGKKYTKIDVGNSGKLMIDLDGNIFGIKAYGVIHRGHCYGTLDTIYNWYWGKYTPVKK